MAGKASQTVALSRAERINLMVQKVKDVQLPEQLEPKVDLVAWVVSLIGSTPFKEKDPDYMARELLIESFLVDSEDMLYTMTGIKGLQDIIPDHEGAYLGPLDITDLYVAKSDLETGAPCYMILTLFDHDTAREIKTSTGAQQLQMGVINHLKFGHWPIRCRIERLPSTDRSGKHLLVLAPPEGIAGEGDTADKPGF